MLLSKRNPLINKPVLTPDTGFLAMECEEWQQEKLLASGKSMVVCSAC